MIDDIWTEVWKVSRISRVKGGWERVFYFWEHRLEIEDQEVKADNGLEGDGPMCLLYTLW